MNVSSRPLGGRGDQYHQLMRRLGAIIQASEERRLGRQIETSGVNWENRLAYDQADYLRSIFNQEPSSWDGEPGGHATWRGITFRRGFYDEITVDDDFHVQGVQLNLVRVCVPFELLESRNQLLEIAPSLSYDRLAGRLCLYAPSLPAAIALLAAVRMMERGWLNPKEARKQYEAYSEMLFSLVGDEFPRDESPGMDLINLLEDIAFGSTSEQFGTPPRRTIAPSRSISSPTEDVPMVSSGMSTPPPSLSRLMDRTPSSSPSGRLLDRVPIGRRSVGRPTVQEHLASREEAPIRHSIVQAPPVLSQQSTAGGMGSLSPRSATGIKPSSRRLSPPSVSSFR